MCLRIFFKSVLKLLDSTVYTEVLISPYPDVLPDVFFYGENILFDASLVIYINSTNIPTIMIINMIYETQNLLSL
jgi:hypothetical protein